MRFPPPTETNKCKFVWGELRYKQHSMIKLGEEREEPCGAGLGYPPVVIQVWVCEHCGLKDMTVNGYTHELAKRGA